MDINCKPLLLESVDLESYGTSKNWTGYFERNTKFKEKIVIMAIDNFVNYFSEYLNECIIFSSLFIDKDDIKNKRKKMLNAENELIKTNLIKTINGNTYFNNDSDIFDQQYDELCNSFIKKTSTDDIIKKISYLVMVDDNVSGHCFFILEKENLIIYPHEDKGYGFFGIKDKNNTLAIDFLSKINDIKEFKAYINKE
jgi:hypothetical protein